MDVFGVGLPELIVIFVVALLVFGPRKLPEISKTIAKTLKGLQDASRDFQTAFYQEAEELERSTRSPTAKSKSTSKSSSSRRSNAQSTPAQAAEETPVEPETSATDAENASEPIPEPTAAVVSTDPAPEPTTATTESAEEVTAVASSGSTGSANGTGTNEAHSSEVETVADLKQDTPEPVAAEADSSTAESSQISAA